MTWNEFKAVLGKIAGFVVAVLIVNFVLMPFGLGIRSFTDVPRTPWLIRFYPVQAHRPVQDRINAVFERSGYSVMHVPRTGHTYILALPKGLAAKMNQPAVNFNGLYPGFEVETSTLIRSDVTRLKIPRKFLAAVLIDARLNDHNVTESFTRDNQLGRDNYQSPTVWSNWWSGKQEIYLLWSEAEYRTRMERYMERLKLDGAAQIKRNPDWGMATTQDAVIFPSDDGNNRFGVIEGKIIRNADRFDI